MTRATRVYNVRYKVETEGLRMVLDHAARPMTVGAYLDECRRPYMTLHTGHYRNHWIDVVIGLSVYGLHLRFKKTSPQVIEVAPAEYRDQSVLARMVLALEDERRQAFRATDWLKENATLTEDAIKVSLPPPEDRMVPRYDPPTFTSLGEAAQQVVNQIEDNRDKLWGAANRPRWSPGWWRIGDRGYVVDHEKPFRVLLRVRVKAPYVFDRVYDPWSGHMTPIFENTSAASWWKASNILRISLNLPEIAK